MLSSYLLFDRSLIYALQLCNSSPITSGSGNFAVMNIYRAEPSASEINQNTRRIASRSAREIGRGGISGSQKTADLNNTGTRRTERLPGRLRRSTCGRSYNVASCSIWLALPTFLRGIVRHQQLALIQADVARPSSALPRN